TIDASGKVSYIDTSSWAKTERDPLWTANWSSIGNNYLIRKTSTGITNSIIYDTGTNVGIGTTSPGAKLDVQGGDLRVSGNIYWNNGKGMLVTDQGSSIEIGDSLTSGVVPYIDFHYGVESSQDYNVRIQNAGNNRLDIITASSGTVLTINTDKVGIGTTSPSYKLEVAGDIGINNIIPRANNTYSLGSSSNMWKNIYVTRVCLNSDCTAGIYWNGTALIIEAQQIYIRTG
ncbi:hypothetical protein BA065_03040, partial [Nanoarchaeota archaeon NZ13-N]